MRFSPYHARGNADDVRQLIRDNPWGTLVSHNEDDLVASYYPVLLDEELHRGPLLLRAAAAR